MKKQLNYNYAFLFYDVGEKRVQKVFKICKKYLSHFQKSVFRGDMTPSKFIQLRNELNRVIDKEEDFVCIIKLMNDNVFGEEVLGNGRSDSGIVDGFAVCPQPFSHFVQTLGHFFFDDTVRGWSFAQH